MSKVFKKLFIGGVFVGAGVVAYNKLLTPYAREQLENTVAKVAFTIKDHIVDSNENSKKKEKIAHITVLEKTNEEWARLGY